ncbi:MAG: ATP-dependent zinc metalloprotease FtsH [Ruminococcaceae bacterium]|nr:ATP-dependent zinc metalloprotease FtsH [Oscillospiraceae bacterium]
MSENKQPKNGKKKIPIIVYYAIITIVVLLISFVIIPKMRAPEYKEITYSEFLTMVKEDKVEKADISSTKITIVPKDADKTNPVYYETGRLRVEDSEIVTLLLEHKVKFGSPIEEMTIWSSLLPMLLMLVIGYLLIFVFTRFLGKKMGGEVMSFGKNTGKIYAENSTKKTFDDVAGQDEAKESLLEIVDFLNNPKKYAEIGAKLPKGALLVGPPGTGKTLLAKAVAGEAGVPFFSISGSEFVEMFVGVGASRVRDLFRQAVEKAPCIVFIDEIDAIGKSRDNFMGGNDEREQTLNQLLAEMDGFDSSKGVVLLAATNRPEVLDKALLRPGRFDRRIIVDLPDLAGRKAILEVHARKVKKDDNVDLSAIAKSTPGASGADLENIINEAALRAVRAKKQMVTQAELAEAVDVILAGEAKKSTVLSDKEKKIVAYHEIGHALVAALLKNTEPVHKITIIPRTSGALGYTMQVSEDEKHLLSRDEALEKICVFAGGRAAEQIEFDSITTGAANDIERATAYAREMITAYGMSDEFGFVNLVQRTNMYLGEQSRLNCSDETAARVDKEIHRVITECYNRAVQLLTENKDKLDLLAGILYEKENITGEEFMALLEGKSAEEVFGIAENDTAEETETGEVVAATLTEEAVEANSETAEPEDTAVDASTETKGNE